jgi:hypothetical protein
VRSWFSTSRRKQTAKACRRQDSARRRGVADQLRAAQLEQRRAPALLSRRGPCLQRRRYRRLPEPRARRGCRRRSWARISWSIPASDPAVAVPLHKPRGTSARTRQPMPQRGPEGGSVRIRLLPPPHVNRLRHFPENDPDHEHGLTGDEVLLVDRRSFAMPLGQELVLARLRPQELGKAHLRRPRSRSFSRSRTARRCGFSSLPGAIRPSLPESGFPPGFSGSTGSNPVCALSAC